MLSLTKRILLSLILAAALLPARVTAQESTEDVPKVYALVSDHIGWTSHSQPNLYWYLSKPTSQSFFFTLTANEGDAVKPILRVRLDPPPRAGIQRIGLKDYDVELAEDVTYEWAIAVMDAAGIDSLTKLTSARIEKIPRDMIGLCNYQSSEPLPSSNHRKQRMGLLKHIALDSPPTLNEARPR